MGILNLLITYMKNLLDSDWLRAVKFKDVRAQKLPTHRFF